MDEQSIIHFYADNYYGEMYKKVYHYQEMYKPSSLEELMEYLIANLSDYDRNKSYITIIAHGTADGHTHFCFDFDFSNIKRLYDKVKMAEHEVFTNFKVKDKSVFGQREIFFGGAVYTVLFYVEGANRIEFDINEMIDLEELKQKFPTFNPDLMSETELEEHYAYLSKPIDERVRNQLADSVRNELAEKDCFVMTIQRTYEMPETELLIQDFMNCGNEEDVLEKAIKTLSGDEYETDISIVKQNQKTIVNFVFNFYDDKEHVEFKKKVKAVLRGLSNRYITFYCDKGPKSEFDNQYHFKRYLGIILSENVNVYALKVKFRGWK